VIVSAAKIAIYLNIAINVIVHINVTIDINTNINVNEKNITVLMLSRKIHVGLRRHNLPTSR